MSNPRTCTHIKVTGTRCGSPALRGEDYCYFHYRMLCSSRISRVALLENEEAIQVSLMEVVNSLLRGTLDLKRGELILRALNTAVRNSRRVRFEDVSGMVRELPSNHLGKDRQTNDRQTNDRQTEDRQTEDRQLRDRQAKDPPKDPIVPPRPPVPSREQLDAFKKEMLSRHPNVESATPALETNHATKKASLSVKVTTREKRKVEGKSKSPP
jgi:hypothetical protein